MRVERDIILLNTPFTIKGRIWILAQIDNNNNNSKTHTHTLPIHFHCSSQRA